MDNSVESRYLANPPRQLHPRRHAQRWWLTCSKHRTAAATQIVRQPARRRVAPTKSPDVMPNGNLRHRSPEDSSPAHPTTQQRRRHWPQGVGRIAGRLLNALSCSQSSASLAFKNLHTAPTKWNWSMGHGLWQSTRDIWSSTPCNCTLSPRAQEHRPPRSVRLGL